MENYRGFIPMFALWCLSESSEGSSWAEWGFPGSL